MRDVAGRRRTAIVALLATALVLCFLVPTAALAHTPPGIDRFMRAVGQVESGGRYDARNARTGAYGKYQILPSNWRAWARQYLGNANAAPTARNQERVARAKFQALWHWLGDWRIVAHWWLTGSSERNPARWSTYSRRYVAKIMALYGSGSTKTASRHIYQETNGRISYAGRWAKARYGGYAGGAVRYASARGATATIRFTGRSIAWIGPVGPTRGAACVYVDGKLVKTVNLHASGFRARKTLYSTHWSSAAAHSLMIEVLGTKGHAIVAIDEFRVGG